MFMLELAIRAFGLCIVSFADRKGHTSEGGSLQTEMTGDAEWVRSRTANCDARLESIVDYVGDFLGQVISGAQILSVEADLAFEIPCHQGLAIGRCEYDLHL
jgi:NTP pyrophosphatase (non-canonical NTP hydrolase)